MFPTVIVDLSTLLFSSNLIASLKKYLKKWMWYMKHIIYVLNLRYQAVWGQCFMRKGNKWDESCCCSSFLPKEKFKAIVREGELRCNQTQKLKPGGYRMNDKGKKSYKKEGARASRLGWGPRLTMEEMSFYLGFGGQCKRSRNCSWWWYEKVL